MQSFKPIVLAAVLAAAASVDASSSWFSAPTSSLSRYLRSLLVDTTTTVQLAGGLYETKTNVLDQAKVDLDIKQIEKYLEERTTSGFEKARNVYKQGGYTLTVARIGVKAVPIRIPKGTTVVGKTIDGKDIKLTTYDNFEEGDTKIDLEYQEGEPCNVGGIHRDHSLNKTDPGGQTWDGCLAPSGVVTVESMEVGMEYNYTIWSDNWNARTLQGLSLKADSRMRPDVDRDYYDDYGIFLDYYSLTDYADEWIGSAFDGEKTEDMENHGADFSIFGNDDEGLHSRIEAIKYAIPFMTVQMYMIREMEEAVHTCELLCDDCEDDMYHSLDKAVALYTGSLEDGSGSGKLMFAMADHRASIFRTAGPNGTLSEGTSKVNHDIFREFNEFKKHLADQDCVESERKVRHIVQHMMIPLIQGTIQYAHMRKSGDATNRTMVEGATWAASVLPWINDCSEEDADIIYQQMKVKAGGVTTPVDFAAVKAAFERNYKCLRITCADVGGMWEESRGTYKDGAEPCSDATFNSSDNDNQSTDDTGSSGSDSDKDVDDYDDDEGSNSGSSSSSSGNSDTNEDVNKKDPDDIDKEIEDDFGSAVKNVQVGESEPSGGANVGLALGLIVAFVVAILFIAMYIKGRKSKSKEKPPVITFKTDDMVIC